MTEENSGKLKCPYCGSEDIAEYLWGTPILNEELKEDLEEKRVVLGGCCMDKNAPAYQCNKCGKDFGISKDWK